MRPSVFIRLFVNGEEHALAVPAQRTLLEALRYDLGLTGSKQGCDKGDCGALQCGFCQPGMMLSARALLDKNPRPTLPQIQEALSGNLCRCTGYTKIYEAVQVAAGLREPARRAPVPSERAAPSDSKAQVVKEIVP